MTTTTTGSAARPGLARTGTGDIALAAAMLLVLGVTDTDGSILLLNADGDAPNGARVS